MSLLRTLFATTSADFLQQAADHAQPNHNPGQDYQEIATGKAVVTRTIAPDELGRVKFQGTWWRAGSDRSIVLQVGTTVRVIGRQRSNILIVEPLASIALAQ